MPTRIMMDSPMGTIQVEESIEEIDQRLDRASAMRLHVITAQGSDRNAQPTRLGVSHIIGYWSYGE
jgi:hypothetical protein